MYDRVRLTSETSRSPAKADPQAVFDQLRKHPAGQTVGAINRALGWTRGARAALQRLQSQGRAYERAGLWFHVPGICRRESQPG